MAPYLRSVLKATNIEKKMSCIFFFIDSIGALWSNGLLRSVRISETTAGSDFILIDLALKLDLSLVTGS